MVSYSREHPTPEDVLLAVEVADTTVRFDRIVKARLYTLTLEAQKRVAASALSRRELIRRLGTRLSSQDWK